MTKTYKLVQDEQKREALEITETEERKKVIDKQSVVDEIARLQALLSKFT